MATETLGLKYVCLKHERSRRNKHGIVFGKGDWTVATKYYSSVGHHSGLLPQFPLFKMCGDWCFPRLCHLKSPRLVHSSLCALVLWPVESTLSYVQVFSMKMHLELPHRLPRVLHVCILVLMSLFVIILYRLFIHCLPPPKPTNKQQHSKESKYLNIAEDSLLSSKSYTSPFSII